MISSGILIFAAISFATFALALPGTFAPHGCKQGAAACSSLSGIDYCIFSALLSPAKSGGSEWLGGLNITVFDKDSNPVGASYYVDPTEPGPTFTPFSVNTTDQKGPVRLSPQNLYVVVNSFTAPQYSSGGWNGDLTFNFGKNQYNKKNGNMVCQDASNGQAQFSQCWAWFDCGSAA